MIVDELYRQLLAGEIGRAEYEALRATQPQPAEDRALCADCERRPAFVIDRGQGVCAVCALKRRVRRG